MAIAFFHFKHISRGNGQSVVAASAYRAGEKLWDESREEWHDYTKKEVAHTEMLVCAQAPSWASDRDRLWNEVERVEKRSDARLARDGVLALPNQLSLEQNLGLVQGFLTRQFVERGMVVDFAIHNAKGNPHCHFLATDRHFENGCFAAKKNRKWNEAIFLESLKSDWAKSVNIALEQAGFDESHKITFELDDSDPRIPQIHLGSYAAMQKGLEDSGKIVPNRSKRLEAFREIEETNSAIQAQLDQIQKENAQAKARIRQQLAALEQEIAEARAIANQQLQTERSERHEKIATEMLKTAAFAFCFAKLTSHEGDLYKLELKGQTLSITAKDGRGLLVSRQGDRPVIHSPPTEADLVHFREQRQRLDQAAAQAQVEKRNSR